MIEAGCVLSVLAGAWLLRRWRQAKRHRQTMAIMARLSGAMQQRGAGYR